MTTQRWQQKLTKRQTQSGLVIESNGENTSIVLDNDPALKGRIRLNELKGAIEVQFAMVLRPGEDADAPWRLLKDADYSVLTDYFTRVHKFTPEEGMVARRVAVIAERYAVDPLRDYLTSLHWDGVARLDDWLATYLGVAGTPYAKLIGRKFLIGAVARGLRPGCKQDTVLIMEGAQGTRKSTAIRVLAGDAFFSDTPIDIGSKDGRIALQGVWIIELAELESLRKSESTKTKAFLSQGIDRFRPPYGRNDIIVPRRCVFVGSSNRDDYLQDETGNRRFWPITCGEISLDALRRDRDQLWAEAAAALTGGEQWWLGSDAHAALAETEAAARVEDDPWVESLRGWLTAREHAPVTREEVMVGALNKGFFDWDAKLNIRVGSVLRRLNWRKVRRTATGEQRWFYQYDSDKEHPRPIYEAAQDRRTNAITLAKMDPYTRSTKIDDPKVGLKIPAKPGATA